MKKAIAIALWGSACVIGLTTCCYTPNPFFACSSEGYGIPFATSQNLCGCYKGIGAVREWEYNHGVIVGYLLFWAVTFACGILGARLFMPRQSITEQMNEPA